MRTRQALAYPRLAARMAELDVLAIELAEQIPCHPAHFSMVLRGHRPASPQLRARVAEILSAEADELFAASMVDA